MDILELYTTYLLSQSGQSTATKLSKILNDKISHDKITRYLHEQNLGEADLWKQVNSNNTIIKNISKGDTDLIIDDTIISKPYRKENKQVCWHYNHANGRCEKGIGLISCMLRNTQISVPINCQIIEKTSFYKDKNTGQTKRKSKRSKNEYFREMLSQSTKRMKGNYTYVLADNWFCSKKNLQYIEEELGKKFIIGIKSNRLISLLKNDDTQSENYVALKSANLDADKVYRIKLKGIDFPLILVKKVFKNGGNGHIGTSYLISNDIKLSSVDLYKRYQKRWRIEEYHRSLKQYSSVSKSPSRKERAQKNHIILSLIAYSKLELLGISTKKSTHCLKYEILIKSNIAAFNELELVQKLAA